MGRGERQCKTNINEIISDTCSKLSKNKFYKKSGGKIMLPVVKPSQFSKCRKRKSKMVDSHEMVRQVHAAKAEDLSSILRNHRVEEEKQLLQNVLRFPHAYSRTCVCVCGAFILCWRLLLLFCLNRGLTS